MSDIALKRFQLALEGPYSGQGFTFPGLPVLSTSSIYNGGSALSATRRLATEDKVMADFEPTWEKSLEARGTYAGLYTHILHMITAKGKVPAYVYADDMCYLLRMIVSGSPTITTLPNTPASLLAATNLAGSMSLTTQPNGAGDGATAKILAVTLSNTSSVTTAVNVTIAGVDLNGNAITETLNFPNGTATTSYVTGNFFSTLYTRNYFKTVNANGITTSAQPAGDQLAVGGVNAFQWVFPIDMGPQQGGSTLYSATAEYFDGTAAWQLPGVVLEKMALTASIGKSFKADTSFLAQKKVLLSAGTGSINPAGQQGTFQCLQNIADNVLSAIPTYTTRFYSDPQGVTPGTTQVAARLCEYKLNIDGAVKLGKAADGTPYPNFVGRSYYGDKLEANFTLLFNSAAAGTYDPVDVGNFLNYASRTIRAAYPGVALPCGTLTGAGNWPSALQDANGKGGYYGMMFDLSGKIEAVVEKEVDGRAAFDFKLNSEVDITNMGVPLQCTIISRVNGNMS